MPSPQPFAGLSAWWIWPVVSQLAFDAHPGRPESVIASKLAGTTTVSGEDQLAGQVADANTSPLDSLQIHTLRFCTSPRLDPCMYSSLALAAFA